MALMALASAAGCAVVAHHVNHGLRPDADDDATLVTIAAQQLGIEVIVHRVVIEPGSNLEARARSARHGVLPHDSLFGHTADDQAETVLAHMLRGAGPTGLAGMASEKHPLLGIRRRETHELCRSLGWSVVNDPTNDDPRFRRNRIRHEVLPLLDDVAGRDVVPLIVRTGRHQRQASEMLERLGAAVDPTDARALAALDVAVAVTALRRWWRTTTNSPYAPDDAACGRMMAVVSGRSVGCDIHDGWRLARHRQVLRLVAPGTPPRPSQALR